VIQKWTAAVVVVCLVQAIAPAPARANGDDNVRVAMEHFKRGKRAYDLGHFLEAAAEYEKAYEAKESPALLYNLGQAYRGAGAHGKALNAYRAYLRNEPDAPNRDEVVRFIDALRHTIELQKQTQEKPPVGTMAVPAPPPSPAPAPVLNPATPIQVVVVEPPPKKREPDRKELALGRKLRLAGIVTGAAGIGLLVAGGVFAGYAASVNDKLNNPSGDTPVYNHNLESKGHADQALETAFFVAGGAAVAASVVTLVVGQLKIKNNSFALAPAVGPSRVAATLRVSF
jgi:tetratricopeptide (TPR) repeat protein